MSRSLLWAMMPTALVALPAVAGGPRALHNAPLQRLLNSSSTNWSGYAATGTTFTKVSASWTQPSVTCTNKSTYSSFWVGLDGDGSNTVEQTGTEADCSHGAPIYFGWIEMYPAAPVNYRNTVRAGDSMSASVATTGPGTFSLRLSDATAHWTQITTATSTTAALASAEVIAEAPFRGTVLPLADFGRVHFASARANGKAIGGFKPDEITMVTKSGTIKARPTVLSAGENFADIWHHS